MEARFAIRTAFFGGADRSRQIQGRERYARASGRGPCIGAGRPFTRAKMPAVECGGAVWRRRIYHSHAGDWRGAGPGAAERLRLWLSTDPMLQEHLITGSFGVASFPVHGFTAEEIIRVADAGMYVSKRAGGD